jgi:phosphoglycolate phosphatase-like HAD superfamily hydrolase
MSSLRLAVFDIDGTLTDTNEVDDRCFFGALADVLKLGDRQLDWSDAPHVTDSALAAWCCERYCGRELAPDEYAAIVQRFLALLRDALVLDPCEFAQIPGVANLATDLQRAGWAIALATGGWGVSARFKLRAAGLDFASAPLACADDALTREEILRCSFDRAVRRYCDGFERVVSIGDGVWDVRAAAAVGWPFVGITCRARPAGALVDAGATHIVDDYTDSSKLLAALATARVPTAVR